jgi:hypothetical protein
MSDLTQRLSAIAQFLQRENEELLYEPDSKPVAIDGESLPDAVRIAAQSLRLTREELTTYILAFDEILGDIITRAPVVSSDEFVGRIQHRTQGTAGLASWNIVSFRHPRHPRHPALEV